MALEVEAKRPQQSPILLLLPLLRSRESRCTTSTIQLAGPFISLQAGPDSTYLPGLFSNLCTKPRPSHPIVRHPGLSPILAERLRLRFSVVLAEEAEE